MYESATDLAARRQLFMDEIEEVVIRPAKRAGGPFDPSRIKIAWKPGIPVRMSL
jgi:hypothetical protein